MYFLPPLVPPLPLSSPTSATVFPASPTYTSVVCVIIVVVSVLLLIIVVVHLVPVTPSTSTLASRTLASQMWAGRVAAAPVAALAKGTEENDSTCVNLCLRSRGLLGLLHLDDAYGVALVVPSIDLINNDIVDHVISLDD